MTANREFSKFSVCNFNHKAHNHPKSFLNKDIYIYNPKLQPQKKRLFSARITGVDLKKRMHKIELMNTGQSIQIKLLKEEIFFTKSVKEGSRLYDIILD
jgi:hypothetical protein